MSYSDFIPTESKLRTVGVKSADELYKSCGQIVRDAADLRLQHENSSHELRESCGLQPQANIKQVIGGNSL